MNGYHAPSFQDRAAASLEAKHKALSEDLFCQGAKARLAGTGGNASASGHSTCRSA